jgi:hypothetical protein
MDSKCNCELNTKRLKELELASQRLLYKLTEYEMENKELRNHYEQTKVKRTELIRKVNSILNDLSAVNSNNQLNEINKSILQILIDLFKFFMDDKNINDEFDNIFKKLNDNLKICSSSLPTATSPVKTIINNNKLSKCSNSNTNLNESIITTTNSTTTTTTTGTTSESLNVVASNNPNLQHQEAIRNQIFLLSKQLMDTKSELDKFKNKLIKYTSNTTPVQAQTAATAFMPPPGYLQPNNNAQINSNYDSPISSPNGSSTNESSYSFSFGNTLNLHFDDYLKLRISILKERLNIQKTEIKRLINYLLNDSNSSNQTSGVYSSINISDNANNINNLNNHSQNSSKDQARGSCSSTSSSCADIVINNKENFLYLCNKCNTSIDSNKISLDKFRTHLKECNSSKLVCIFCLKLFDKSEQNLFEQHVQNHLTNKQATNHLSKSPTTTVSTTNYLYLNENANETAQTPTASNNTNYNNVSHSPIVGGSSSSTSSAGGLNSSQKSTNRSSRNSVDSNNNYNYVDLSNLQQDNLYISQFQPKPRKRL